MDSRGTVRALFVLFLAVVFGGGLVVFLYQLILDIDPDRRLGEPIEASPVSDFTMVPWPGPGVRYTWLVRWVDASGLVCYQAYSGGAVNCAQPPLGKE